MAVTFGDRVLVETSQGTPTLALTVGTQTRQASYVRGTGTTQLVFAYTVVAADSDTDGIAVAADALALNGGAITEHLRRAGAPRPRCGGGAVGPRGGRVTDAWLQPDGRGVRAHGAGARQAGGPGERRGGQQRGDELLAGDGGASRSADRDAGPVERQYRGAEGGGLRGARRNHHSQPRQQCADRAAGAGVRAADGSDDAHARRQSRRGGVRAAGGVGPVWRVRRGVGRERDARGGGGGGRPGRSLGEQCHVCLEPDGRDRRDADGGDGRAGGICGASDGGG